MNRKAFQVVALVAGLCGACSNSKRALLQADVTLASDLQMRVTSVDIEVNAAGRQIATGEVAWEPGVGGVMQIGIHVVVDKPTEVTVHAIGRSPVTATSLSLRPIRSAGALCPAE